MTLRFGLQGNPCHVLVAKVDRHAPIGRGGSNRDRHPGQPTADEVALVLDADDALCVDLADQIIRAVLDRRQRRRERPWTRVVATGWRGIAEGGVWSFQVVGGS